MPIGWYRAGIWDGVDEKCIVNIGEGWPKHWWRHAVQIAVREIVWEQVEWMQLSRETYHKWSDKSRNFLISWMAIMLNKYHDFGELES